MNFLAEIPFTSVELRWARPVAGAAEQRIRQLRGALGNAFREDARFHQHGESGQVLYRYPPIQYRWREGYGVIAGWESGAETLLNLPWLDLQLSLNQEVVTISDALINTQQARFAVSDIFLHYHLISPILLFSQKNFAKYRMLTNVEQQAERQRLLVANLLSGLKGLSIRFPVNLQAVFNQISYCKCHYKDQDFLGITGEFACNALLPSGFAFGHAVSHGYGWIERR